MTIGKHYYYLCALILEENAYHEMSKFWDDILSCSKNQNETSLALIDRLHIVQIDTNHKVVGARPHPPGVIGE